MKEDHEVEYRRATRQSAEMAREDVWDFVGKCQKMTVAYCLDGAPHATPVYFACIDRKLYFRGPTYDRKMGPASGGNVCCLFETGVRYTELRGVLIRGRSKLLADPGLMAVVDDGLRKKYSGLHWRAEEMPERWVEERRRERSAHVEVTPTVVSSWDNGGIGELSTR